MDFPADANQAELRTYPITRFQRMGYDTYQATELTLKWYGGSHAMFCMTAGNDQGNIPWQSRGYFLRRPDPSPPIQNPAGGLLPCSFLSQSPAY